jgi:phosphoribosylanthranilate isomerase
VPIADFFNSIGTLLPHGRRPRPSASAADRTVTIFVFVRLLKGAKLWPFDSPSKLLFAWARSDTLKLFDQGHRKNLRTTPKSNLTTLSKSTSPSDPSFIKVCGVCTVDDVRLCAQFGATAIGLILVRPEVPRKPGSDRLERHEAAALAAEASALHLDSVLLVHAVALEEILELTREIKPTTLQIQTSLSPDMLRAIKGRHPELKIIKTITVPAGANAALLEEEIRAYVDVSGVDAVLLDSQKGGSGVVHDWATSATLVERLASTPMILAGGLNAENVAQARRQVRPFGVDVMSGVNCPDRRDRKDPTRLSAFIKAWKESSAQ